MRGDLQPRLEAFLLLVLLELLFPAPVWRRKRIVRRKFPRRGFRCRKTSDGLHEVLPCSPEKTGDFPVTGQVQGRRCGIPPWDPTDAMIPLPRGLCQSIVGR